MRILAWLLAAYAVIGVVMVIAASVIGGPLVARVDRLATQAQDTMSAATDAARTAAEAVDGFDTSVGQAHASASDAAALSRETAGTLDALAVAMGLSVLGNQPLLPLADQFERSAEQMRQLGDNLDGMGQALTSNREDIRTVGAEMAVLADELAELEGRIGSERAAGPLPLSWLFYGFLLWQLLPIAAAAVGAAWLFRNSRQA